MDVKRQRKVKKKVRKTKRGIKTSEGKKDYNYTSSMEM